MSNLFVNSIQPLTVGPITVTSASLLGLSSATTTQILYYNTSSGVVTFGVGGGSSIDTGSFYISSSVSNATITFNQGDGTTEAVTVNNVQNAVSASFFSLASVDQDVVITGSVRGNVNALSISSNTASLDLSNGNFFTLQLVSGSNTFINPSNILPGQTINLRVNTTGSGTVSFPSSVKQVSGSAYVPTTTTGVDVVTFISFDATSLLLSNVKNFV
jgi:hypothetical protein